MSIPQRVPNLSIINPRNSQIQNPNQHIQFQVYLSDQIYQRYQESSNDIFSNIQIKNISVYQKDLEKSLPWYKSVVATIAKIPKLHTFIYIEAEDDIFITIDLYSDNRIVERVGKSKTQVLKSQESLKREESQATQNKKFMSDKLAGEARGLTIGEIRQIKVEAAGVKKYNELNNNCSNYCQRFIQMAAKKIEMNNL